MKHILLPLLLIPCVLHAAGNRTHGTHKIVSPLATPERYALEVTLTHTEQEFTHRHGKNTFFKPDEHGTFIETQGLNPNPNPKNWYQTLWGTPCDDIHISQDSTDVTISVLSINNEMAMLTYSLTHGRTWWTLNTWPQYIDYGTVTIPMQHEHQVQLKDTPDDEPYRNFLAKLVISLKPCYSPQAFTH